MDARLKALWLEFEHFKDDRKVDFFNMQISLDDGRRYALNVWTFEYATKVRDELDHVPAFSIGPDLLVESANRRDLEAVVKTLLREDSLKDHWLIRGEDDGR